MITCRSRLLHWFFMEGKMLDILNWFGLQAWRSCFVEIWGVV